MTTLFYRGYLSISGSSDTQSSSLLSSLAYYILLGFFFTDTATTEIYTLSLHDALPIFAGGGDRKAAAAELWARTVG